MTAGKTTALTSQTFVDKVMSLLLNMLSRLVITFLPRTKRLLISWLQSASAVVLEPRKNKVSHCFHCYPIYFPWGEQYSQYWRFSFSISPSNEHPGLISFRMDWVDLLAVQGTLKSLLQHHSSKASIFRHSAFFTVQLSPPYMTTGKTIKCRDITFPTKVHIIKAVYCHSLI